MSISTDRELRRALLRLLAKGRVRLGYKLFEQRDGSIRPSGETLLVVATIARELPLDVASQEFAKIKQRIMDQLNDSSSYRYARYRAALLNEEAQLEIRKGNYADARALALLALHLRPANSVEIFTDRIVLSKADLYSGATTTALYHLRADLRTLVRREDAEYHTALIHDYIWWTAVAAAIAGSPDAFEYASFVLGGWVLPNAVFSDRNKDSGKIKRRAPALLFIVSGRFRGHLARALLRFS